MSVPRLMSVLAALALLFAPIVMIGGAGAAMAMPHASESSAAPGHCADMADDEPAGDSKADISCMMACAMIQAPAPRLAARAAPVRTMPSFPAAISAGSLDPEAETPPPRLS